MECQRAEEGPDLLLDACVEACPHARLAANVEMCPRVGVRVEQVNYAFPAAKKCLPPLMRSLITVLTA